MAIAEALQPLTGAAEGYDPLLERAAAARFVLLGEASHGTHEFYRERAEIMKRSSPSKASLPSPPRPTGPTRTA